MASSSATQLTMDSFDTYLDAVEAHAPKHTPSRLADEVLSEHDREHSPTYDQVYYWRELVGALTLCGATGMADDNWPAELAPSQGTLKALVDHQLIIRRGGA